MILITRLIILFVLLTGSIHAQVINYKKDGSYRLLSNKHLINEVDYKVSGVYQTVVEIPTGSRDKWEVNHDSGHLEWEFKNNKPRKVKFLGYPGNYGFIPQTLSGDNDPLDIIVLSESSKIGDILKIRVLGMIKLLDKGEIDNKIIAVTSGGPFKKMNSLKELLLKKPTVIPIVKYWFEGYKKPGKIIFMGYGSEKKAIKYIEESHVRWKENYKND